MSPFIPELCAVRRVAALGEWLAAACRGGTQRKTQGGRLPAQAGLLEFYYPVLTCSPGSRSALCSLAHAHGTSGLTRALGLPGAGCELLLPHQAPASGIKAVLPTAAWALQEEGALAAGRPGRLSILSTKFCCCRLATS